MDNNTFPNPNVGPVWFQKYLSECNDEGIVLQRLGTRSLKEKGRILVWNVCKKFNCHCFGIPGQACCFMEQYIEFFIRRYEGQRLTKELVDAISPNVLLIAAVCVNLAAKMQSIESKVNYNVIRGLLAVEGHPHSIEEVQDMELQLLAALKFQVPLSTSMEISQYICVEFLLEENVVSLASTMIDIAELNRHKIDKTLRDIALKTNLEDCKQRVRSLHLSAGTVAAAVKLENQPDVTVTLAGWLQIPEWYLACIREVIISVVAKAQPLVETSTIYRRRTSVVPTKRRHGDNVLYGDEDDDSDDGEYGDYYSDEYDDYDDGEYGDYYRDEYDDYDDGEYGDYYSDEYDDYDDGEYDDYYSDEYDDYDDGEDDDDEDYYEVIIILIIE